MSELKLRDGRGRFTSDAEENQEVNNMLKALCGLQPAPAPAPVTITPANSGQPVPPGAGPEPEQENTVMNRALLIMAGGIPSDSR